MNREEHTIIGMLVLGIILISGILNFIDGKQSLMLFSITFTIFTTALSPDIDKTLPFLSHRGITHSWKGLIVIAVILGGLVYITSQYTSNPQNTALTYLLMISIALGAVGAWMVHMITDRIYDIFRGFTWLIVIGLVLWAYTMI